MNLNEIEAKCFIMALFIRDDGLRFLLGSGAYEFKDSQLMFAGNTIENDVVSVQGNDGYMLAGQVRRPSTQAFNGYIGDATVQKAEVESYRRDFMAFFQKNHFYTVVYIMADGSAVQRRRGFLVDAPTVQEIWQMYPEYHVALNFEDVNYYKYSENDEGEETYGKSADIGLAKVQYGGLIWANNSDVAISGEGTEFSLTGTVEDRQIESVELNGDTEQTTYSGKNLLFCRDTYSANGVNTVLQSDGSIVCTGSTTASWGYNWRPYQGALAKTIPAGTYTFSRSGTTTGTITYVLYDSGKKQIASFSLTSGNTSVTVTTTADAYYDSGSVGQIGGTGTTVNRQYYLQFESGSTVTSYEPYVGGVASPNPDYPQEVQTVTGRQVVTISDGDSQSQEYEINLGKNLFDKDNYSILEGYFQNSDTEIKVATSARNRVLWIPCSPSTTYSIKLAPTTYGIITKVATSSVVPADLTKITHSVRETGDTVNGYTTDASARYLCLYLQSPSDTDMANLIDDVVGYIQIEKGSTATTYAPYFTPIELCKIGTYRDYIYKSGEDWYLHKETNRHIVTDSEDTLAWDNVRHRLTFKPTGWGIKTVSSASEVISAISDKFVAGSVDTVATAVKDGMCLSAGGYISLLYWPWANQAAAEAQAVGSNIYYALATSTDTQITDATLITQLEALSEAHTAEYITWFKTDSAYLPAILSVSLTASLGGGVIWDNNGAEWEEGGGGEVVIVNVDSIENIFPVWTINGKAVNPTLTNLTTGMSVTYNGTVASGQTLVVDLLNKTAKLDGTSVISDISGQWVEFQPGNNRVSYSTDNADAPNSTIEWQEVVG